MDVKQSPMPYTSPRPRLAWGRLLAPFTAWRQREHPKTELALDGLTLLTALLFARTHFLFGAYPLGLGLLCALRGRILPCFAGVVIGALTMGATGPVYVAVYVAALLLRLILSFAVTREHTRQDAPAFFREELQLRICAALLAGFFTAAYELLVGGVRTESLLFAGAMLLTPALFTLLFAGFFSAALPLPDLLGLRRLNREGQSSLREKPALLPVQVGLTALFYAGVLALRPFSLFGVDFSYCLAAFYALFVSRRWGALRGCAAGLLAAMGASAVYAPAFGILGLLSGALWQVGAFYALGLGLVGGALWAGYSGGTVGFLSILPELTLTAVLGWPFFLRLHSSAAAAQAEIDRTAAADALRAVTAGEEGELHMHALTDAFGQLSRLFAEVGARERRPREEEYYDLCEQVCLRHCTDCSHRAPCWEHGERIASSAMHTLASRLAEGEEVREESIPSELLCSCTRLPDLLSSLRAAVGELRRSRMRGGQCEMLVEEYGLLSHLMQEATRSDRGSGREDRRLTDRLRADLPALGLPPGLVTVRGGRQKKVYAAGPAWGEGAPDDTTLTKALEPLCGCRFGEVRRTEQDGVPTVEVHSIPRFAVERYTLSRPARSEEVSGDATCVFESGEDVCYALLSDGMGSGREAADTAGICVAFLEKLLLAGAPHTPTLKLLNNLLRAREEECAATIDLLELDLLYGHACFLKSGAAPSYVKRGSNLFRIRSKTVPIGILRNVDAERIRFEVQAGDIIVLLSDGISQCAEDAPWLLDLLSCPAEEASDLAAYAARILQGALEHGERTDDMTVLLLRVTDAAAPAVTAPAAPPASVAAQAPRSA